MVGIFAIKQPVTLELVKTLQIIWMTGIVSCGSLRKPDSLNLGTNAILPLGLRRHC
jgi:hypothetical protein